MDTQWIDVTAALPLKDTLVLASGWDPEGPHVDRVFVLSRLLDSGTPTELGGPYPAAWAEDSTFDELPFKPTHWLPVPDLPLVRPQLPQTA